MGETSLLKFFRSLGCEVENVSQEDVDWMWRVQSAKPFLEWLTLYVDNSNILAPGELEEYKQLCAEGNVLRGEELEKALKDNDLIKETMWADEIDHLDLLKVQEETNVLQNEVEVLGNLHLFLSKQLKLAEEEETEKEKELREAQLKLHKEGQSLMKLNAHIKHSYSAFYQSLSKLSSTFIDYKKPCMQNSFFSQMPLDEFISQCDRFDHNMRQFMKCHFAKEKVLKDTEFDKSIFQLLNGTNPNEVQSQSDPGKRVSSFQASANDLWKVEVQRVSARADLDGLNASFDCLLRLSEQIEELSTYQMRLDCISFEQEVTQLTQHVSCFLDKKVAEAVESLVLMQIVEIAIQVAQQRINRRRCRLDTLHTLRTCLDTQVHLVDLVWMLLCREEQCVKFGSIFVGEVIGYLQEERSKHISTMALLQKVQKQHHALKHAPLTTQCVLLSVLQRMLHSVASHFGSTVSLELVAQLEAKIIDMENVQVTSFCSDYMEKQSSNMKALNELAASLVGATKKPLLLQTNTSLEILSFRSAFSEIIKEINALENSYLNVQTMLKKSPIERVVRLLWAWFMVAPNRLVEVMNRAEQHANIRNT